MGSHISLSTLTEYWPLVVMPCFLLSFTYLIGEFAVIAFGEPTYVIPGMVFNNVIAMPLLLTEAISTTKVLDPLLLPGESVEQAVIRAKSYILMHGVIHNISRFALGPLMLKKSTKPEVVRRMSLAISQGHCNPDLIIAGAGNSSESPAIEEETLESNLQVNSKVRSPQEVPANESTSLFDSHYSVSDTHHYGSLAQSNVAPETVENSTTLSRAISSPEFSNINNEGEREIGEGEGTETEASPAKFNSPFKSRYAKSFGGFDEPSEFVTREFDEFEARKQYFYHRARQLTRNSVDLEETRALLSTYFDEMEPRLKQYTTSKSSDSFDPSNRPANANSSLPHSHTSEHLEQQAEENKSIYNILPQWLVSLIQSIPPIPPSSPISKIYKSISPFLNPAVISGTSAIVIGITPWLHHLFFNFAPLSASLTPSINNIGELYPALQLFALGSKLTTPPERPLRASTILCIAVTRYLIVPFVGVAFVVTMLNYAPTNVWPQNKMLNFVLMILPAGPPAITLAAVAEIAGVPQSQVSAISRMLVYLYAIAPLVAPTVAVALSVAYTIKD